MNALNQTLQEKFPHLELSVLKLSEVQRDNESLILGSDFNSNTRQKALQILKSNNKVSDYFDLINTTISSIAEPSYIYDLTHSLGNFLQDVELTQDTLGSNKKEVKENDFIISRLRSYLQEMAVIQAKNHKQLVSTEYLVYRPKTNLLSSNTLMVFALSKIVQTILKLSQYGTEHPRFYEFVFNEMPIPEVIIELNNQINFIMIESYKALEQSKALYKEAEDLLYTELGLNPQNPLASVLNRHCEARSNEAIHNLAYFKDSIANTLARFQNIDCHDSANAESRNNINFRIATLKESFLKTGRLDSEYYQVKYEEIESFIQSYQGGFSKLEIVEIKDSNFTPKDKEKYRYIELANIGSNGNISTPLEELGEDLPTRARRLVKEGDLIISSVEGSLGSCALITKEFHHCIVSTGFYVLKSHSINSETLLVLFKSSFFQHYLKKFPSGTILSAISKEELQNILIPKINPNTQDSIASHIQQSFALRNEAKALLNEAKAKVESAIIGGGGGVKNSTFLAFINQIFRI